MKFKQEQAKFKIFILTMIILFFPIMADARTENCSTIKFSDGLSTKILSFPAGGGYNSEAKVSLPIQSRITSARVDLIPQNLIGTPYIWVPQSSGNKIYQIDIDTGAVVNNYPTGSNPSRVTVMPGGDVWVANRDSVNLTRLSPALIPAYSVSGTYPIGNGPRGVTFDYKGNIWAFDYYDNTVWKFTAPTYTSSSFANTAGYPYIYGAIGDSFGYVWMVGDIAQSGVRRVNILNTKTNIITLADTCTISGSAYIYGIGMDNQGNIFVANYGGGGYCKIGGVRSGANFGKIMQTVAVTPGGSRGIAVDGNNNIWMANSNNNHVYVFSSLGVLLKDITTGYGDVIGVAIDFDNNAWVVSNGSGHVLKYGAVGAANEYQVIFDINIGGSLYNYSDMTGLRTTPNMLSIGDDEFVPISGNTYSGFNATLQSALVSCSCIDTNGEEQCSRDLTQIDNCLVPLNLFSATGGNYNATNLKIICSVTYPDFFGGLVPCGRLSNDPGTGDIDESQPCSLCAMFYLLKNIINFVMSLSVGVAVFILIMSGLFYALSAGNSKTIDQAKSAAKSAIIGIAIIFIAWLGIAIILQGLGYASIATWNQVSCDLPLAV